VLSIGAIFLFVFGTALIVMVPIFVWLIRDLRRIGRAQVVSGSKEEDSPAGSLNRDTQDPTLD